ncbi:MAG: hypothetical protein ACE5G1_12945 [bacterium]
MKALKADIDFLIQEKKRLNEERAFLSNFDSTNPDTEIEESSPRDLEEDLILTAETESQAEGFLEAADGLQFDINDSLIVPADKPQTDGETFVLPDHVSREGSERETSISSGQDEQEKSAQPFILDGFSLEEPASAEEPGLSPPDGKGVGETLSGELPGPLPEEPSDFSPQLAPVNGLDEDAKNIGKSEEPAPEVENQAIGAKRVSSENEPTLPNVAALLGGDVLHSQKRRLCRIISKKRLEQSENLFAKSRTPNPTEGRRLKKRRPQKHSRFDRSSRACHFWGLILALIQSSTCK